MRIIDKNSDFYDYLQNIYKDDSLTFDRTDSFELTREMVCDSFYTFDKLRLTKHEILHDYNFILMQICNTFWLFLIEIIDVDEYNRPKNYTIELVSTWKNYNKNRELTIIEIISFYWDINMLLSKKMHWRKNKENIFKNAGVLVQAIDTNNYRVHNTINKHIVSSSGGTRIEKHIPLLKSTGIPSCVDALDVFLAFEEFFSLEKTSSERTESIGLTDKERIQNHGFDTKTSFRGKT